jgi:peroxiredoxin
MGVYFLVLNNIRQFEFVVGENQRFGMSTTTVEYVRDMKVTGDVDNQLFFENMLFNAERHREAEPLLKVIQDSTIAEGDKKTARDGFEKVNEKVTAYQNDLIARHPGTITAKILRSTQTIKIPDAPKRADGTTDSTFQLRWYRQHFFDNFDLGDPDMICMPRPMYRDKVFEYLDKLYAPNPDTITMAINQVLERAKKSQETYKYAAMICLIKYQQPEIMGLDEVYVNIFDQYYASGEMDFWVNDKLKKNLKDHADRLRKSLVGKQAPNLIMQDANFKPRSMYDIKKRYTVVYIFDPDCSHCKEETPKLVQFYNTFRQQYDLEVYAVSTDTSMAKMRDYIREMKMTWITVNGPRTYVGHYNEYDALTTPALFVLDEKKKIIAKKVPAEKLDDFLTQYERFNKQPKTVQRGPTGR